jgi:hypothetical protein
MNVHMGREPQQEKMLFRVSDNDIRQTRLGFGQPECHLTHRVVTGLDLQHQKQQIHVLDVLFRIRPTVRLVLEDLDRERKQLLFGKRIQPHVARIGRRVTVRCECAFEEPALRHGWHLTTAFGHVKRYQRRFGICLATANLNRGGERQVDCDLPRVLSVGIGLAILLSATGVLGHDRLDHGLCSRRCSHLDAHIHTRAEIQT